MICNVSSSIDTWNHFFIANFKLINSSLRYFLTKVPIVADNFKLLMIGSSLRCVERRLFYSIGIGILL